jgi:hypothetical protein
MKPVLTATALRPRICVGSSETLAVQMFKSLSVLGVSKRSV